MYSRYNKRRGAYRLPIDAKVKVIISRPPTNSYRSSMDPYNIEVSFTNKNKNGNFNPFKNYFKISSIRMRGKVK